MSVYRDILAAVKTIIQALSLSGFDDNVVIRKKPHITKHDGITDTQGIIVISPSAEIIAEEYTENLENINYPVHITFAQGGNGVLNVQATEQLLDARESVRRALHKPSLSGVSSVIDTQVFMSRAFNPGLFGVNYDASQLTVIFKSTEARET
jgi:hypothetical protein